jgi:centromere/kinetochore protein ZW10
MAGDDHAVGQALLQAVAGKYPDVSETLLTTEVDAGVLPGILQEIEHDRKQIFTELRQTSREVAPDVDGWIQQAKKLQADIERSKETARSIVLQAEEAAELRRKHDDVNKKAGLINHELVFNQKLETALASIQDIYRKTGQAQSALQKGHVKESVEQLMLSEALLAELRHVENSSAIDVLSRRSSNLREDLVQEVKRQWVSMLHSDRASRTFTVNTEGSSMTLIEVQQLSSQLDILVDNIGRTRKDLEDVVFKPRLEPNRNGKFKELAFDKNSIIAQGTISEKDAVKAMNDILKIVHFLHARIPSPIMVELSELIMPPVITRLINHWLIPAVPTVLDGLPAFQELLEVVQELAGELAKIGWHGTLDLEDWVEKGPKTWLSKRKESSLDAIRHMLTTQVSHTRIVERVETQVVAKNDVIHGPGGAGDDWDAWAEEEDEKPPLPTRPEERKPPLPTRPTASATSEVSAEDDDWNAWDADEHEETVDDVKADEDEEGDAWGWDEASSRPESPEKTRKQKRPTNGNVALQSQPTERQLTLKEKYTVTTIPESLVDLISALISDARALLTPSSLVSSSAIAPAAAGMYGIPTLILACYRALAPTYYTPLSSGGMYLYNDSLYLTTLLKEFYDKLADVDASSAASIGLSTSAWPSSRLRLEPDIATLTSFGARAYGREMDAQRTILRDLLDGAQGFTTCTEQPFREACESAVSMACDRVRDLATLWAPVLSRSAVSQSLGSLVATITSKLCVEIEELQDISEEESQVLRGLCDEVSKLADLFVQDGSGDEQQEASAVHIYSPDWFKFQYLSEILVSSLADIKYLWTEGELKLEFEADEIVMLIEALFSETDHRRRAIAEIRRG